MLYDSKKRKYNITNSLVIREKNVIVHYISDQDFSISENLDALQLSFLKVPTIIIPRIKERFNQHLHPVNPNTIYNTANEYIKNNKDANNYNIKRIMTKVEPAIVLDHSHIVESILNAKVSNVIKLELLFSYLNKKSAELNVKHKGVISNLYIFNLTSMKLYEILATIRKKYQKLNIDNVAYVTIPRTDNNPSGFIPFIGFNASNEIELLTSKFSQISNKLKQYISNKESEREDDKFKVSNLINGPVKDVDVQGGTALANIKDKIMDSATNTVNPKSLKAAFVKHTIPESKFTSSLTSQIKHSTSNKTDAEEVTKDIANTIHKSLYGSKKLNPEFIDNPEKLMKIASKVNVSSKKVKYTKEKHTNVTISAKDLVAINEFTAPVKHQFEFNDQIHTKVRQLFTILENNPDAPIEVKSFKYEYKDDNINRFIEYTVKVKNKTGGRKGAYELKLKVPALVNEKYFKLHGKEYILSTQQFLMPITKDKPNRARFTSQYNMITLKIEKLKFSISQIKEIIEYINLKHSTLLTNVKTNANQEVIYCKVNKDSAEEFTLDFINEEFYKSKIATITIKNGKFYLTNKDVEEQEVNANQFVFEKLNALINSTGDTLNQSKRILPYIQIHVMGRKLPFIIFLAHRLGMINALLKLNVDYEIIKGDRVEPKSTPTISYALADSDSKLHIYTSNVKQELVINGLATAMGNNYELKLTEDQVNNPQAMDDYINNKYGSSTVFTFDLLAQNFIDPVTKELFESQGKDGDDLYGIMTNDLLDKLINDKEDNLTDLNHLRSRQSELITALLYRELAMATNRYKQSIAVGMEDAHLFLQEDYIINNLLGKHVHNDGSSMLNYINNFGPVEEIVTSSRVIKTGIGGIPNVRSFRKEHRDLHKTHIGNISSHGTSEYTVGVVNQHTLGTMIDDSTGTYLNPDIKELKAGDNWAALSIDEGLTPFIDQMDSDRLILARTHNIQKIPIKNPEIPIVSSGAETIIGHIASSKFVKTADKNGTVIQVNPDADITVKYNDGTKETFNITPRYASTKRHSTVIRMKLNTLKVGEKFEKDQMVYWTDSFNGDSYTIGRNATMAILNYDGMSHEDGYVISDRMSKDYVTDSIKRISVLVPPHTKLKTIKSIGDNTNINDPLIEFVYIGDLQKYLQTLDSSVVDEVETVEEVDLQSGFSLNENVIKKLSIGGEIVDIKIFISTKADVGSGILNKWKEQNARLNSVVKKLKTDKTGLIDNIDMSVVRTQGSKKFKGALIEFFVKNEKTLTRGDKLSNRFGAKGVISKIIPEEESVVGEVSGVVDVFIAPTSVLGRKNTCILKELYLGKIIKHLSKWAKSELAKNKPIADVVYNILEVYKVLDPTKEKRIYNSINDKFKVMSKTKLTKMLYNEEFSFNIIIPPFVKFDIRTLKITAKMINLQLDEYVNIPGYGKTKKKVPVGPSYFSAMEQLSEDYETVRSTSKYNPVTGQPLKGKSESAQAVGELDLFALLGAGSNMVIRELYGARTDNFESKSKMISDLRKTGKTDIVKEATNEEASTNKSTDLFKILMTGMGVELSGI